MDTISAFWGKFRRPLAALDRCTLNRGAFAFEIVRGTLKWPLKGGSRLIEVTATAGLTVHMHNPNNLRHSLCHRERLPLLDLFAVLISQFNSVLK